MEILHVAFHAVFSHSSHNLQKIGSCLGKSTMADRAAADRDAGPLRWGRAQREMLRQYLQDGLIDFSRLDSAAYMRELAAREEVWRVFQLRGKQRNFNQNVRRGCREWQVEAGMHGARRDAATPGGRRGNNNEDDDDDDEDYQQDPDSESSPCSNPDITIAF